MSDKELPDILRCSNCGGGEQTLESARPEGRRQDLWRVVCACGHCPLRWSVTKAAAIRLWNRHMTSADG